MRSSHSEVEQIQDAVYYSSGRFLFDYRVCTNSRRPGTPHTNSPRLSSVPHHSHPHWREVRRTNHLTTALTSLHNGTTCWPKWVINKSDHNVLSCFFFESFFIPYLLHHVLILRLGLPLLHPPLFPATSLSLPHGYQQIPYYPIVLVTASQPGGVRSAKIKNMKVISWY